VLDPEALEKLGSAPGRFTFYPGDVLVINIFEEPEFRDIQIRISSQMKINFPYVGEIHLRGKGIIELENELRKGLVEKMLSDAQVSVFLKTPAKRWVYTLGKLRYPQAFEIPPMGSLCVADAISLSRGFDKDADRNFVEISRTVDGKIVEFLLPASYFKTFALLPGDKLRVMESRPVYVRGEVREPGAFIVPEYGLTVGEAITKAKVKEDANFRKITVERTATDGSRTLIPSVALDTALQPGDMVTVQELRRVYVIGSVKKPGGYAIPAGGLRATMAVALAEGWTRLAAPNDTYVKRKMPDGTIRVFEVPLKDIMQGKYPEKNIELLPGDEVYVPESFF
jgi:polysaccharide export outer membrane protein